MPSTYTASTRLPYSSRTVRSRSIFSRPQVCRSAAPGTEHLPQVSEPAAAPVPAPAAGLRASLNYSRRAGLDRAVRRTPPGVGLWPVHQAWPRPLAPPNHKLSILTFRIWLAHSFIQQISLSAPTSRRGRKCEQGQPKGQSRSGWEHRGGDHTQQSGVRESFSEETPEVS